MDYNSPYVWLRHHQAPFVNRILRISDLFVSVILFTPPASLGNLPKGKTLQIYNLKMRLAGGRKYARAIYSANLVVLTHNGVLNVNGTNAMKLAYV